MQTNITNGDTSQAYIFLSANPNADPTKGQGGVPFTQVVGALTGYYEVNTVGQDTAIMLIIFKKNGIPITLPIKYKFQGSVSTFTKFKVSFTLPSAPDSVIIAATSSNIIANIGVASGSWLILDQLQFAAGNESGTNYPIPGGSFDNWTTDTIASPIGWNSYGEILRSTSHESGSYSVELVTTPSNGGGQQLNTSGITTGTINQNSNSGPRGGNPYTLTSDTLKGYYKYIPQGNDTGNIDVSLSLKGSPVGGNGLQLMATSNWTEFSMPFSSVTKPDTIRVDASSSSYSSSNNKPGSALFLDLVYLASAPLHNSGIHIATASGFGISSFPNPVNDILHLKFNDPISPFVLRVFDMDGKMVISNRYDVNTPEIGLSVSNLKPGVYTYEITSKSQIVNDKFVKY